MNNKEELKAFTIRVSQKMYEAIRNYCFKKNISKAEFVRTAIKDYLVKIEQKNSNVYNIS